MTAFRSDLEGLVDQGWDLEEAVWQAAKANLGIQVDSAEEEEQVINQFMDVDIIPTLTYKSVEDPNF